MKGCLTIILAFVALALLINYSLLTIGIILISWGVREYKLNKQLKVKSKLIPFLVVIGCVMSISGCSLAIIEAEEQKKIELQEQEEAKRQQELEKQAELERQQALEKQAELERQQELEKQAEIKRQQQLEEQAAERSEPTVEREHFRNCDAMNAVYPNGVPADHPAYASARDRDKDGWACER